MPEPLFGSELYQDWLEAGALEGEDKVLGLAICLVYSGFDRTSSVFTDLALLTEHIEFVCQICSVFL